MVNDTRARLPVPEIPPLRTSSSWSPSRARWVALSFALLCAVSSILLTHPETTADAPEYARDIVHARTNGLAVLAEPGHLVWRPLGYAIAGVLGLPADVPVVEQIRLTQFRMTVVASITGAIAAMALALLTWGLSGALLPSLLAPLLLVTSSTFIDYAHAGTSYMPALASLTAGMCIGWRPGSRGSLWLGAVSGGLVALSVLCWLPLVLVVPAALLGALLIGWWRGRSRLVPEFAVAVAVCAVVGFASYGIVAESIGIRTLDGFMHWIRESSHGVTTGGLTRMVIGLPRSFVDLGNDGREVKRYLLGDPLNPVFRSDLLWLGLWWKMFLFYAGGAMVVLLAFRDAALRRGLGLLALAAVPTLAHAMSWMGGDGVRYLAIYPFGLPLLAMSLQHVWERRRPVIAMVTLGSLVAIWLLNIWSLGRARTRVINEQLARIACVTDSLDATALIVVPHHGDPLYHFARNHLQELPRRAGTQVIQFVRPGAPELTGWQDTMRARLGVQLRSGGRIWVADYVRDSVPPREMGWVEGLDRRAAWADIRQAWGLYDLQPACAGRTGLLRVLEPSAASASAASAVADRAK